MATRKNDRRILDERRIRSEFVGRNDRHANSALAQGREIRLVLRSSQFEVDGVAESRDLQATHEAVRDRPDECDSGDVFNILHVGRSGHGTCSCLRGPSR